jgi:glycosyltransferase involved in cell wall biosynthesis
MKVMYLIWSLGYGGAEKMVCSLALDHGPDVEPLVCCLDDEGYHAPQLKERGIQVIALNKKRGFDFSVFRQLRQIIRTEGVQLVNSHLWSANLYARLLKITCNVPLVAVEHNVDMWKKWYHFAIDRVLAARADAYIYVSQAVSNFYRENVPATQSRRRVIYNGIELAPYRETGDNRRAILDHFNADNDAFLLINIGRLVEAKNQAELVRVTRALVDKGHDVYTLIVGDGPLRGELEREINAAGMQDRFWLTGNRDDVPLLLKGCDLFVLTSGWEGLPLVVLETMSAGTLPVFYDVGGTAEIVRDGLDGFKIPAGDTQAMIDTLDGLLHRPQEIVRCAENGRTRALAEFDTRNMVNQYEVLFSQIVQKATEKA